MVKSQKKRRLSRWLCRGGIVALMATVPCEPLLCSELQVMGGNQVSWAGPILNATKDAVGSGLHWLGQRCWEYRTTICMCAVVGGVVYLLTRNDKEAGDNRTIDRIQGQINQILEIQRTTEQRTRSMLDAIQGLSANQTQSQEGLRIVSNGLILLTQQSQFLAGAVFSLNEDGKQKREELTTLQARIEELGMASQDVRRDLEIKISEDVAVLYEVIRSSQNRWSQELLTKTAQYNEEMEGLMEETVEHRCDIEMIKQRIDLISLIQNETKKVFKLNGLKT